MFYTAIWCLGSEKKLKEIVPLDLLGASIQKYKSTLRFRILVLEGYSFLSAEYIQQLTSYGFEVVDFTEQYKNILNYYPKIVSFYSLYERNCFLRWIAFKTDLEQLGEKNTQFWHLDSDIVLFTSLDELAFDTQGKTFMLQGCPALTSVSHFSWFETYENELNKLNQDILSYSQTADSLREFCIAKDKSLCNHSYYRNPIGSDQDFLEYLVSSGKIYQEKVETIFNSKFFFVQSPLEITQWDEFYHWNKTDFVEMDTLLKRGTKIIPFIHYHNTFCYVASFFSFLKKYKLPQFLIEHLIRYKIEDTKFSISLLARLYFFLEQKLGGLNRNQLIPRLEALNRKESLLTELLNILTRMP